MIGEEKNKITVLSIELASVGNVSNNPNPYLAAATSHNTRRNYQSDITHFQEWGGKLPASIQEIIRYLQAFADTLNPRTLARRLTALKNWHVYQGFVDPTSHPTVKKTMIGIMRTHGKPKERAAPLLPEYLMKLDAYLSQDPSLRAIRDNALIQIGFFGAFRRSELVNIRVEDIEWKQQGIDILIPTSKTDQTHEGQYCAIPYGTDELCPIRALKRWLDTAEIEEGFVFRRLSLNEKLNDKPMSPQTVNLALKRRAEEAGFQDHADFSSHSMRRGLASSASQNGASLQSIMRQGRWRNVNSVLQYIDAAQRFEENAANKILKQSEKCRS